MYSRILTHIRDGVLADALYESGRLMELSLIPQDKASILGNIYVGRVKNVVRNIQAAFVEIEKGVLCYLPLEDLKHPIYVKPKKQERLVEGDELLVQVCKEASKTKGPSVTSSLSLDGKYLVLTSGNLQVGYSSKLKAKEKEALKAIVGGWELPDAGLIVRTNAAGASLEELTEEFERLRARYGFLTKQAVHQTVFSCVHRSRPEYLTSILGSRTGSLKEIVTDDEGIYGEIRDFLQDVMPKEISKLRFYENRDFPLKALYRLEKGLSEALSARVWLRSGAYLVIEPTEALTVIDVNTGKYTGGRDKEETIWKINREAAEEIARQLRLRNLSGMIVADFVDMETEEENRGLMELMREKLKHDPQKANVVDMTGLGLMELTRKKEKKTLAEQAKECGI